MNHTVRDNIISVIVFLVFLIVIYFLFFNPKQSQNLSQYSSSPTPPNTTAQYLFSPTPTPTPWNCITSQDAPNYMRQNVCVKYFVGDPVEYADGNVFLNERSDWWNGFSVFIPSLVAKQTLYDVAGDSMDWQPYYVYGHQWIEVMGTIQPYNNAPEIVVHSASQIKLSQEGSLQENQQDMKQTQQNYQPSMINSGLKN